MPCECGPDTRRLWEQVRDLMVHHDELYDKYLKVCKERDQLKAEQDLLFRKLYNFQKQVGG